jgi:predicted Zn-dependent protease
VQASFVEHDHVIQALAANGADHPFDICLLPGRAWRRQDLLDSHGIQANPASAKLLTLLGVLLVRSGDVAKGQKAFQEAQQLSPESGLGRIGLASTLMQMGLAADAAQVLSEQLAVGGPDAKTELTLARALLP